MQSKYKGLILRLTSFVPSIIVVFSLIVFYGRKILGVGEATVSPLVQNLLSLWLTVLLFSIFIVLGMMVAFVLHVVLFNKVLRPFEKIVWIVALWVLNALAIPVYYLKYLNNEQNI